MTRKKFVKKLMAEGFSRNEANRISIETRESGMLYQKYYEYKYQWFKLSVAMSKVGNSFDNVCKSINKFANETTMSLQETMYAVAME